MDPSSGDMRDEVYIFIDNEAEVKTAPLGALPVYILRKLRSQGIPCGSADAESITVTWISPVEIREREQPSHRKGAARAVVKSLVTKKQVLSSDPIVMTVATRNRTAFNVLEDYQCRSGNPNKQTPAWTMRITSHRRPSPHHNAIIIHNEQLYLSIPRTPPLRSTLDPAPQTKCQEFCPVSSPEAHMKMLRGFGVTRCVHVVLPRLRKDLHHCHLGEGTQVRDHTMQEQSRQQRTHNFSSLQTGGDEDVETTGGEEEAETTAGDREVETTPGYGEVETTPGYGEVETTPGYGEVETTPGYGEVETTPGDGEVETTGCYVAMETTNGAEEDDIEMEEPPVAISNALEFSLRPASMPATGQHHAAFDYDQVALEERINRTRARLREREAALPSHLPDDYNRMMMIER